jgi:acylphosphatase
VEVVAEGPRAACERLLEALRGDDAPGFVGHVDVTWSGAEGGFSGFRER